MHNESLNASLTVKSLVNTYYDDSVNKLYKVNSDGTKGEEIKMGMPVLDFANPVQTLSSGSNYTAQDGDYLYIATLIASANGAYVFVDIDGKHVAGTLNAAKGFDSNMGIIKLGAGQIVSIGTGLTDNSRIYILREM